MQLALNAHVKFKLILTKQTFILRIVYTRIKAVIASEIIKFHILNEFVISSFITLNLAYRTFFSTACASTKRMSTFYKFCWIFVWAIVIKNRVTVSTFYWIYMHFYYITINFNYEKDVFLFFFVCIYFTILLLLFLTTSIYFEKSILLLIFI